MRQKIMSENKKFISDCFQSQALPIDENNSITYHTFFSSMFDDSDKHSEMLKLLTEQLYNFVHTDNVILVYPDVFSEFQLADMKRTAKLFYHRVRAVPKSLSVIFSYTQTEHFLQEFNAGDSVIILDRTADGVSLTPIKSHFDERVAQDIPEQKGIVWEHRPIKTAEINFLDELNLSVAAKKILSVMSVKNFIDFAESFDFINDNGNLKNFSDDLAKLKNLQLPIQEFVESFCAKNRKLFNSGKIWIVSLSNELDCTGLNNVMTYADNFLLDGVKFFDSLKSRTSVSLWRDCLPDLSIKRLYGTFDLVKDSTFEYGSATEIFIPIPGNRNFTLPKGQKKYRFKLHMSDSNEKTFYEAVVEHKNFPLKNDVECRLIMKYTYGDDNPYSLKFVPIDKNLAGFAEVSVRWERAEDFAYKNLPYPTFPPPKTWEYIRHFPNKSDDGTNDLLEKAISLLHEISELQPKIFFNANCYEQKVNKKNKKIIYTRTNFKDKDSVMFFNSEDFSPKNEIFYGWLESDNRKRYSVDASGSSWFLNKKQEYQLITDFVIDGCNYKLNFFKSNFIFQQEFNTGIKHLNFSVPRKSDGTIDATNTGFLYAKNILADKGKPIYFFRVNDVSFAQPKCNSFKLGKPRSFLLFCLHKIYFNGRSSKHPSFPQNSVEGLRSGIDKIYTAYKDLPSESRDKDKMFHILCVASKDVTPNFIKDIEDYVIDCVNSGREARYELGFVLGDFSEYYQKSLFEKFSMLEETNIIAILAKAVWRNENFIKNFSPDLLKKYFEIAIDLIADAEKLFTRKNIVMLTLEFILAVFRLREDADDDLSKYLSLNNPKLRRLYACVEHFISINYIEKIKSRITFDDFEQSVEFRQFHIHDFYYALLTFITGERGESDIVISEISDDGKGENFHGQNL